MLLTEALPLWLVHLFDHDGKSSQTIHGYKNHVQPLVRELGPSATGHDFNLHTLRRHLKEYETRCRPRSVCARIIAFRSFGEFLMRVNLLNTNPASIITMPPVDDPVRRFPSDEKLSRMVAACSLIQVKKIASLSRALLLTCIHTGLRASEVTSLKLEDVDLGRGVLHVRHGKGNKPRDSYPHEECIAAIRDWLLFRPENCWHNYLFVFDRRRRVAPTGLRDILKKLSTLAGYDNYRDVTPHCLRRAYATRIYRKGGHLDDLRRAMGHSNIVTTSMYLFCPEDGLRRLASLSTLQPEKTQTVSEPTAPLSVAPVGKNPWPAKQGSAARRKGVRRLRL